MSTGLRIPAFLLALTAVFALGFGLGALVDPVSTEPDTPEHSTPEHSDPGPTGETSAPTEPSTPADRHQDEDEGEGEHQEGQHQENDAPGGQDH